MAKSFKNLREKMPPAAKALAEKIARHLRPKILRDLARARALNTGEETPADPVLA